MATDMVLWTEGKNPMKNCIVRITDLDRFNKPNYSGDIVLPLGNIMPKPKHPLDLSRFITSDTVTKLRLDITFNSDALDYTEKLRMFRFKDSMYMAYKVESWEGRLLKQVVDKRMPNNINENEIWK